MRTPEITYYSTLNKKFGDEITRLLTEFIQKNIRQEMNKHLGTVLTKSDKTELISKVADSNDKLNERIDTSNGRIDHIKDELLIRMNSDKIDLIDRMQRIKNDTVSWIVGIGLLQVILSILTKKFL